MPYCPSCEYASEGICTSYEMAISRYSPVCELYSKKQTKAAKLKTANEEQRKLKSKIYELEEENKILKGRLAMYEL